MAPQQHHRANSGTPVSPVAGEAMGHSGAVLQGYNRACAILVEAITGLMVTDPGLMTGSMAQEGSTHWKPDAAKASNSELDAMIVEHVRNVGSASPFDLRAALGLTRTPCTKALNRLVAKGILISGGSTRDRVYRLNQPSKNAAA